MPFYTIEDAPQSLKRKFGYAILYACSIFATVNHNSQAIIMQSFDQTIVWRHRKENLNKCSLRGLEHRKDFRFYTFPTDSLPDLSSTIALAVDAPPLEPKDSAFGLLILDATWRYAEKMVNKLLPLPGLQWRSIPSGFQTAYPRRQEDCPDPKRGLASIEAIYISYFILGRDTAGLLDGYYWREAFLDLNKANLTP